MQRLKPGLVLSERYRLIGHVASGGMGQLWEGWAVSSFVDRCFVGQAAAAV